MLESSRLDLHTLDLQTGRHLIVADSGRLQQSLSCLVLWWQTREAVRLRTYWSMTNLSSSTKQVTSHPTTPEPQRRNPPLILPWPRGMSRSTSLEKSWTSWDAATMFRSPFTLLMPRPTMSVSEREPAGTPRKLTGTKTNSVQKTLVTSCQPLLNQLHHLLRLQQTTIFYLCTGCCNLHAHLYLHGLLHTPECSCWTAPQTQHLAILSLAQRSQETILPPWSYDQEKGVSRNSW